MGRSSDTGERSGNIVQAISGRLCDVQVRERDYD
jgi:hypothetical protein